MWHRISKPILLSVLFYFWFSLINQNINASEIQKVEFQKRVVLCPWSSKDEESIALMTVSKNIEFVLNHLGVYIDYFDLDTQTLPNTDTKEFKEKYLGVLSYFINENTSQSKKWLDWLIQYSKTNLPWVALGKFGFLESAEEKKIKQVFEKYNFKLLDISSLSIASSVIPPVPNWMEYERKLPEYFESIPPIITLDKSAQLGLKLKLGFKLESTPVFISKTLSVAYSNYGLFVDAQARRKQWLVNPFTFFKKAFALNDDRLIPDVNVLNGRRVMFIHVDGDGFDSKSFIEQKDSSNVSVERYCGEILESEIFNGFYDFPFGVSLIVSEVDQDEEGNERLMENAKRIFALNNVEIGTHTYDHPLHWGQLEPYETSYNISKNKVPNLEKEIFGSVKYFKKLAQGKEVKTVHWSGDCVVGEKALEVSEKNNLLNINGGDSIYDTKHPSITYLSALGRPWGKYFQVFSGNANENIYTDGWKNNYYAFREVIETFQKTSDPIYKPINLYFHFYTGEREVSVKSLKDVLSWTRARPLSKVFPSTYVESVNGYRNAKISKNSNLEYIAENIQGLNTFRIDEAKNLFPQLNSSTGLIGYTHIKNSLYLFINPKSDRAEFKLTKEKNKSEGVFLEAVSGRISRFEKTSSLVKIDIDPFTIGPLVLSGINQTKVKIKFEGETKTIVVKNKSILIPFNYSVESRTLEVLL